MLQVWRISCMLSVKQKNSLTEAKPMTVCGDSVILQLPPIYALCSDSMFNFTCFNVEDPDDPQVGLFNGELAIPGNLLRREVFDPVVNQVRSLFNLHNLSASASSTSSSLAKYPGCTRTGTGPHRGTNEKSKPTHRCPPSRGRLLRQRIPVQESRSKCLGRNVLNGIFMWLGTSWDTSKGHCAPFGC